MVVLSAGTCTSAKNRRIRGVWPLRGAVQWPRYSGRFALKAKKEKVKIKGLTPKKKNAVKIEDFNNLLPCYFLITDY